MKKYEEHHARARQLSRAAFLRTTGKIILGGLIVPETVSRLFAQTSPTPPDDIPRWGFIDDRLRAVDANIVALMKKHLVPCAGFALIKDGELLANRAYGYKNPALKTPLPVKTRFRLASLDKPLTFTGAELMARKALKAPNTEIVVTKDLRIFKTLYDAGVRPPPNKQIDPRLCNVTIRHLMEHKGALGKVPSVQEIQGYLGLKDFPTPLDMLRWYMGQPLEGTPGAKTQYSSSGYECLRGVMHWVTGDFFSFMREQVFRPTGCTDIGLSKTKVSQRDPEEVWFSTNQRGKSVFPEDDGKVLPLTDGGGWYGDDRLLLTATAEAIARYMDYWYFNSARLLREPQSKALRIGNDNGWNIATGGWVGAVTMAFQRRHSMCQAALLFNQGDERPNMKMSDMTLPIVPELEKLKW